MGITPETIDLGEAGLSIFGILGQQEIQTYLEDFYAQLDKPNDSPIWRFLSEHPTLTTDKKLFQLLQEKRNSSNG